MKEIWEKHKERLFYGGLALAFSFLFVVMACLDLPIKEGGADWVGAAKTILIGLAMLCYNKTRGQSPENKGDSR